MEPVPPACYTGRYATTPAGRSLAPTLPSATPVRVFVQFGLSPLYTAAKATLQNDIIGLCGGQNIFAASPVSWPQVSREQVLMRHPQVIVTTGGSQQAETLAQFWRPQLNVRIIAINEDWLSRPGPRILLAAEQLCEALHPAPKASSGH